MQSVCLPNVLCVRTCSTVGAIQKAFSLDDEVNKAWQESTSRDGGMSLSRYI